MSTEQTNWTSEKLYSLLQASGNHDLEIQNGSGIDEFFFTLPTLLFEDSSYWNNSIKPSYIINLHGSSTKKTPQENFYYFLSNFLIHDEKKIKNFWETELIKQFPSFSYDQITIDQLMKIRDYFFTQRNHHFALIHELLRIDNDPNHKFYERAQTIVTKLLDKQFFEKLLQHLQEKLISWIPITISMDILSQLIPSLSTNERNNFLIRHNFSWILEYLQELHRIVDTLLLISYSRVQINTNQLISLIQLFYQFNFTQQMYWISDLLQSITNDSLVLEYTNLVQMITQLVNKINFQFVLFFTEQFQFWKLFQAISSSTASAYTISYEENNVLFSELNTEQIQTITNLMTKSYPKQSSTMFFSQGLITQSNKQLMYYLWKQFLRVHPCGNSIEIVSPPSSTSSFELALLSSEDMMATSPTPSYNNEDDITKIFLQLVMMVLPNPNAYQPRKTTLSDESIYANQANLSTYCLILVEMINVFIQYRVLLEEEQGHILDLQEISTLIAYVYQNEPSLVDSFVAMWNNPDVRDIYPLTRLISLLAKNTAHEPLYLFQILSSLSSNLEARAIIIELLDQPVNYSTVEDCSSLRYWIGLTSQGSESYEGTATNNNAMSLLEQSVEKNMRRWISDLELFSKTQLASSYLTNTNAIDQLVPGTKVMYNKHSENQKNLQAGLWPSYDAEEENLPFSINLYAHRTSGQSPEISRVNSPEPRKAPTDSVVISTICGPFYGHEGRVIDMDLSHRKITVQWDVSYPWWIIVIDAIVRSHTPRVIHPLLRQIFTLLSSLTDDSKSVWLISYLFNQKWDEIALFILLRESNCSHMHRFFLENKITVHKLLENTDELMNLLTSSAASISIDPQLLQGLLKKVYFDSQETKDTLYLMSFPRLYAKGIVSLIYQDLLAYLSMVSPMYSKMNNDSFQSNDAEEVSTRFEQLVKSFSVLLRLFVSQHLEVIAWVMHYLDMLFPLEKPGKYSFILFEIYDLMIVHTNPKDIFHIKSLFLELFRHVYTKLQHIVGLTLLPNQYDHFPKLMTFGDFAQFTACLLTNLQYQLQVDMLNIPLLSTSSSELIRSQLAYYENYLLVLTSLLTPLTFVNLLPEETNELKLMIQTFFRNGYVMQTIMQWINTFSTLAIYQKLVQTPSKIKSLKDLFTERTPERTSDLSKGIYPIDFTALIEKETINLITTNLLPYYELILTLSLVSMDLFSQLLLFIPDNNFLSGVIGLLESKITLFSPLVTLLSSSQEIASHSITNIAAMFGLISLSLDGFYPVQVKAIRTQILQLLIQLIDSLSNTFHWNLLEHIGYHNISGLSEGLINILQHKKIDEYNSYDHIYIWKLFAKLVELQPNLASLLINSKAIATNQLSSEGSSTISSINHSKQILELTNQIITHIEDYFTKYPHVVYAVLTWIKQLFLKSRQFPVFRSLVLELIQLQKFWDHLTYPLVADQFISINQIFQDRNQLFAEFIPSTTSTKEIHLFTMLESSLFDEQTKIQTTSEEKTYEDLNIFKIFTGDSYDKMIWNEEKSQEHYQQLMIYSLIFEILALERYGLFLELDNQIGSQMITKIHQLYTNNNFKNHFKSWIEHFVIQANDHIHQLDSVIQDSEGLLWSNYTSDTLIDVFKSGRNYPYSLQSIHQMLWNELFYVLTHESYVFLLDSTSNNALNSSASSVNSTNSTATSSSLPLINLFQGYKNIIQRNHRMNVSVLELHCLQYFKQFLELYIVPGPLIRMHKSSDEDKGGSNMSLSSITSCGSFSPVTLQPDASPATLRESTFSGDKRSYEVVNEILHALQPPASTTTLTSMVIVASHFKVTLLQSMLHHQLKHIQRKDNAPEKSIVNTRDIGSMRLSGEKLEIILQQVISLYEHLYPHQTPSRSLHGLLTLQYSEELLALPSVESIFQNISFLTLASMSSDQAIIVIIDFYTRLRLLNVLLLVLTTMNSSQHHTARIILLRQKSFAIVLQMIQQLFPSLSPQFFEYTKTSPLLRDILCLFQLNLQLLITTFPANKPSFASTTTPSTGLMEYKRWQELSQEYSLFELLIQMHATFSSYLQDLPNQENDYTHWNPESLSLPNANTTLEEAINGLQGSSKPTSTSTSSTTSSSTISTKDIMNNLLLICDLLIQLLHSQLFTSLSPTSLALLIDNLTNSPLLLSYKHILLQQTTSNPSLTPLLPLLLGYHATTKQESKTTKYWKHSLLIIQSILSLIHQQPYVFANEQTSIVYESVTRFLQTFEPLIVLSLQLPLTTKQLTFQSMDLLIVLYNFVVVLQKSYRLWRASNPLLYEIYRKQALIFQKQWCLMLWNGEELHVENQILRLITRFTLISTQELNYLLDTNLSNEEDKEINNENNSVSSKEPSSPHVRFGENKVFLIKNASVGNFGETESKLSTPSTPSTPVNHTSSILKSSSPMVMGQNSLIKNLFSSSKMIDSDKNRKKLINILSNIEITLFKSMFSLIQYLRLMLPSPESIVPNANSLAIGATVFITSEHFDGLGEGMISQIYENNTFDVMLVNQLVVKNVSFAQIKYTICPMFDFKPTNEINQKELDPNINKNKNMNVSNPVVANPLDSYLSDVANTMPVLTTGHFYRSLQYLTSFTVLQRFSSSLQPDLLHDCSLLTMQILYLLLRTLDHHSFAPMQREAAMITQLHELQKIFVSIQQLIQLDSNNSNDTLSSHKPTKPSILTNEIHWKESAQTWKSFLSFTNRWYEETLYRLQRIQGVDIYHSFEPAVAVTPSFDRRTRIGLQQKIEWVHTPEEV